MADYLNIIYDQKSHPKTSYPEKLVKYLFNSFKMQKGQIFLEPGCGRGEFLNEFYKLGLKCHGIDLSQHAGSMLDKKVDVIKGFDLENDKWPYPDNFFDIIYSKSIIEHFYYPDKIFEEAHRVLKPGGIIITLTPEWKYIYKSFYDDHTHRVPFTKSSLGDILKLHNFKQIHVESFIQLPIIFNMNIFSPLIKLCSVITRILFPDFLRMKYKWVRFSKEIMLLAIARK